MEFSTKELAGTYSLQYAFGLEELHINSNGSYIQTLAGPKRTLTNSGTWVLEKRALYLHDALSFADPRGNEVAEPERNRGTIGLETSWYFGRLVLDANPDHGLMYEKRR